MPAFQALTGMPYWVDLRSSDLRKSKYFYSRLLGWEIDLEQGSHSYLVARQEGLPVAGIMPNEGAGPDTWVTYFLSDDVEQSARDIATAGGRVFAEPIDTRLGRVLVAADAVGGLLGFIEPAGEEAFVAAGEPGTVVWHDYSCTSGFEAAVEFYERCLGWQFMTVAEDNYSYATALAEGLPFAGIRDASQVFPEQMPSFWQSFLGVRDVKEACATVRELGGEVIRAPFDSEFGRLAIIADSTGATVTLCAVPEPVAEEELSEADDILNL